MSDKATICWKCTRATGGCHGCSWSNSFEPVAGWDAEKRLIRGNHPYKEVSYIVQSCPEFTTVKDSGEQIDKRDFSALARGVIQQAVRDWLHLCGDGKKKAQHDCNFAELRDFFLNDCDAFLFSDGIGVRILKKLEKYKKAIEEQGEGVKLARWWQKRLDDYT